MLCFFASVEVGWKKKVCMGGRGGSWEVERSIISTATADEEHSVFYANHAWQDLSLP